MNNYFIYLKITIYISSAVITIILINNIYFKIHVILKVEMFVSSNKSPVEENATSPINVKI